MRAAACDLGGQARCASLTSLRCSEAGPAAELATFASLTALRQLRQVRSRSACCARAASRPALLGASHAPRSPRPRAFVQQRVRTRPRAHVLPVSSHQPAQVSGWCGQGGRREQSRSWCCLRVEAVLTWKRSRRPVVDREVSRSPPCPHRPRRPGAGECYGRPDSERRESVSRHTSGPPRSHAAARTDGPALRLRRRALSPSAADASRRRGRAARAARRATP